MDSGKTVMFSLQNNYFVGTDVSRIARNETHSNFNERHEVSPNTSTQLQHEVMKCLTHSAIHVGKIKDPMTRRT